MSVLTGGGDNSYSDWRRRVQLGRLGVKSTAVLRRRRRMWKRRRSRRRGEEE